MTASIVALHADGQKVTGTGTVNLRERRCAGYVNADGTNDATVILRDGSASGDLIFEWDSPIGTAFWPTVCESGVVYYDVSGTTAFVVIHSVVV